MKGTEKTGGTKASYLAGLAAYERDYIMGLNLRERMNGKMPNPADFVGSLFGDEDDGTTEGDGDEGGDTGTDHGEGGETESGDRRWRQSSLC